MGALPDACAQWAHETRCLDFPTVSVSHSTVPHSEQGARYLYDQVHRPTVLLPTSHLPAYLLLLPCTDDTWQVQADCAYQSDANLHMSGELCDAWERCAPAILGTASEGGEAWPSTWRDRISQSGATPMAVRRLTGKREDTMPAHYCNDEQGLVVDSTGEERDEL